MVVLTGIRHAESQGNPIEETRLRGLDTQGAQIVTGVKQQFVLSFDEVVAFEDRAIAATVIVGLRLPEALTFVAKDAKELNTNPLAWAAKRGIQYMGGQASHKCPPLSRVISGSISGSMYPVLDWLK
tara:strand:+ start:119 stop:499 length:381 start_codon:yes stop_codon:yes gene_type:complete